jgi:hypothetical protein
MNIDQIEIDVACNDMTPAQVFTQMNQHVNKAKTENKAQSELIVKLRDQLTKAIEKIQPTIKP